MLPPVEITVSTRHFRVAIYARTLCANMHDVMNIQHAHCGLAGRDRDTGKVGP